jgi:hypothetical protein
MSSRELPVSEQHETPEPEWWSTSAPSDPQHQDHGALADAAASMRDAAEMMRDASTPPKESNWSLSWLTNWLKYRPNGQAFKRAVFSSGPASGVLLWVYSHQPGNSSSDAGAAAVFFTLLIGIGHLVLRNSFSRWLLWGAVLAPVFYLPAFISIIVGIAVILTGGN